MSRARRRLSRDESLGDTFGHRVERIHAASRSTALIDLESLLTAFADEPDPAVRKLLALAAFRAAGLIGEELDAATSQELQEACQWALPR